MASDILGKQILELVAASDLAAIERTLSAKPAATARTALLCPFAISSLLDTALQAHPVAAKLLSYEVHTISPFHLASLLGENDLIVTMLDKDVDVNSPLDSASTALHLAAFAGHLDTVAMLVNVYRADTAAQDRYGWSSLHYAATEGHLDVVKMLVDGGVDINLRDKDGTSAAWRAKLNKHEAIVNYLCGLGDEEELLNIEELDELYAKVNKPALSPSTPDLTASPATKEDLYASAWQDATPNKALLRQKSSPAVPPSQRPKSDYVTSRSEAFAAKSQTLPPPKKPMRQNTVRRIIREELEKWFSDYEQPIQTESEHGAAGAAAAAPGEAGMGMGTLTGLMREEFDRYRREMRGPGGAGASGADRLTVTSGDYEDVYETLNNLPQAPDVPSRLPIPDFAPPLPPRNQDDTPTEPAPKPPVLQTPQEKPALPFKPASLRIREPIYQHARFMPGGGVVQLQVQPTSMALEHAIYKIAPKVGNNWKKLAEALPMHREKNKTSERVRAIENQSGNHAAMVLDEWKERAGVEADVDQVILALRKCGLHDLIEDVDKATQEFTA